LEDRKTSPMLAKIIENLLLKWKEGTTINPDNYTTDFNIRDAIRDKQKNMMDKLGDRKMKFKVAESSKTIL